MHITFPPARRIKCFRLPLWLFFIAFSLHCTAFAQQRNITVSGTITDAALITLPGVSVIEKGTRNGVSSNEQGKFTLSVKPGAILVFTSVGYKPKEVAAGASSGVINVQLSAAENQLNEVVAIGYQNARKSDVTGAIASIKAKELNLTSPTLGQALVGKVAGVQISQTSGAPYKSTKIRVRGIGSINASSDPLYVVDGYPVGNDPFINPDDIASIDILKDAASAAIYGSRAAGGVVIITTKRGQDGRGKFSYSVQAGVNQLSHKVKLLNAAQFTNLLIDGRNSTYKDLWVSAGKVWNDAMYGDDNATRVKNVGNSGSVSIPGFMYDFKNRQALPQQYDTDWQDVLYKNAGFQRHDLSFSGGTKDIKYFLSGGYQDQQGIISGTSQTRINFRGNIDAVVSPKLNVSANIAYTQNNNKEIEEGRYNLSPVMAALIYMPNLRPFNDDGTPRQFEMASLAGQFGVQNPENPLALATLKQIGRIGNRSTYNASASYKPVSGLTLKANLGLQAYQEKYSYYLPTTISNGNYAPSSPQAVTAATAIYDNLNYNDKLAEFTAAYNKLFGQHRIDAIAGYSVQQTGTDRIRVSASGFQDDNIPEITAKGADPSFFTLAPQTGKANWTLMSYLARVNYAYNNRYFLSASFRRDASSRFGANNRWGNFPALSAGWTLSDESFYNSWLGEGSVVKLRASWGLSGNNNIGNYNSVQVLGNPGGAVFGNGNIATAIWPDGIKDSYIGWESTSSYNTGLDLRLLHNRLSVIANLYESYSYNLLFNQPISALPGSTSILTNLADSKIRNRGFDIQLDGRLAENKDFSLNLAGNLSLNRNIVLDMGGAATILTAGAERSYKTHITQQGYPVGMFYGFKVLGIATAENYNKVAPSSASSNPMQPGDLYFEDVNKDGKVDDNDKQVIGSPYPSFTYGFGLNSTYKNFDFRVSFNGSKGGKVLDGQDYYLYNMEGSGNQYADVDQRFRSPQNPGSGQVYRASRGGTQSNSTRLSTFYLQNGSYLRCTNAMLGYTLRARTMPIGITAARLFVSVDNAFTITKYKGYNPEVDYNSGANLAPGVDYGNYPLMRAYNIGLSLTF